MTRTSGLPRPEKAPRTAMSTGDFAAWHVTDMVFARPVHVNGEPGFAVFGADGTFLDVAKSMGEVILAAHANGMDVAAVH
ncbi:MAG: hypothetical protein H7841_14025 [Magnetospirillum sp. WYHS-4]